jgi:anti-sigma-K factor RskA
MIGNGNGDHARFGDDVAPWLLRALSDDEQAAFERHLAACGRCREEVVALRPAVEVLPLAAPPVDPPPELGDRIMRVVNSEAELLQAAGEEADRPEPRKRERRRRPMFASLRPGLAAAAACVALAAGVIGYAIGNSGGGGGGGANVVAAKVSFPTARVSLRTQDGDASLQLTNMPSPPRGRVYQVWLKRDGEMPRPTRALFVVRSGSVSIPGGVRDADQVLVTAEPRGGSPMPTRQPVIAANTA